MAEILPSNAKLDDVMELEGVNVTFSYSLTEEGAKFKSLNIIEHTSNPGITVQGANFKGSYKGVFSFGNDSLRYREGDDLKSAATWEDLPDPKKADLFLWRAPTNLRKTFTYTVELKYTVTTSGEPGGTPSTSEKTLKKVYSQDVVGNWSIWGNQLREYVNAGK